MHRRAVLKKINDYSPGFEIEKEFRARFLKFINFYTNCFERSLEIGHLTGSAWIINKNRTHALLTHHARLDRWLQPGGHADGDTDIIRVATKEACEETGLKSLHLLSEDIFDIDIHTIPEYKGIPEHLHYDIRFLFEADENEQLVITNESKDLQWVAPGQLLTATENNQSILRMAKKIKKDLESGPF